MGRIYMYVLSNKNQIHSLSFSLTIAIENRIFACVSMGCKR